MVDFCGFLEDSGALLVDFFGRFRGFCVVLGQVCLHGQNE
jgi:hypothetical protein